MREDPRQRRTREALGAALVHLLLRRRPLDDITVSELCREAGVHRTTFYGHAESVHAFAVATFSSELDGISAVEPRDGDPVSVARLYLDALRASLELVAARRAVFRAVLASTARGAFRAALEDRLRARAIAALQAFDERGVAGVPTGDRARSEAAAFIAGALVGVIAVWAVEDATDADDTAARVLGLMPVWWPLRG